ncbi:hypothetical protein OS493_008498 [Desmophyllum pertusum]|uniref:Uncharacterized protein n=1 Tax=Desmophyllum pertusum TaxID=174260 RepID=A0A9W9ZRW5_9CNID|nr:hypothetical protein OS493_008498 [Desmophyllum pertusum]
MRTQSPAFRNVCFPCTTGFTTFLQVTEGTDIKNADSPCSSNRSSASSTSSVNGKIMDSTSPCEKELTDRLSLGIEQCVVNVGTRAQLRRRNSSLKREKLNRRTEMLNEQTNSFIEEEWSETFVAQDGVLTTNFCSTEL